MIKLRVYVRAHPITVSVIVLVCAAVSVRIGFAAQNALAPGETSFLVTGETTEFTFHAAAQDESQDQAGIFASSDRTVDLQISCTSIQQTASISKAAVCPDGMLSLEHVSVAKVRLNGDTRVDLAVANGNLIMTLTQRPGGHPVVTLFSDEKSTFGDPRKSLPFGEWTVNVAGPAVRLSFINSRLDPKEDEGGETLMEQSAVAFEREGASGFQANTGKLSLAERSRKETLALADSRLQISAIKKGKVLSLRPVISPNGRLQSLRVQVRGESKMIKLIDVVSNGEQNLAFSTVYVYTGKKDVAASLFSFACGGATFIGSLTGCYEFLKLFKKAPKTIPEQLS